MTKLKYNAKNMRKTKSYKMRNNQNYAYMSMKTGGGKVVTKEERSVLQHSRREKERKEKTGEY